MNRHARVPLMVALFTAALALRPQLSAVGPLLPQIRHDLGLAHASSGLLSTLPLLCMGIFALPASRAVTRFGSRATIAGSVGAIALAGGLRALLPGVAPLLALTVLFGIGAGIAGVLLPVAVKERFPDRSALGTGLVAFGLNVGAAISAAVAVPVSRALDGWRASLGLMACASGALGLVWFALTSGRLPRGVDDGPAATHVFRNRTAWLLALLFGLQATCFYGLNAWLADAYVEHGWSATRAGVLVGAMNIATLPATLAVMAVADRFRSRAPYLLTSAALLLAAIVGLLTFSPLAWVAAPAAGAACGSLFPLVMTLGVDAAEKPREAGGVASLMLGGGYVMSALAPVLLGLARDVSGGFSASLWILVGVALVLLVVSVRLMRSSAWLSPLSTMPRRELEPGHAVGAELDSGRRAV